MQPIKPLLAGLLLVFAFAAPAQAAVALIAGTGTGGLLTGASGSATTTQTATTTADVPPGSLIAVIGSIRGSSLTINSCSDSAGNIYVADTANVSTTLPNIRVFRSGATANDLPNGGTISCVFSSTATRKQIQVWAFSGQAASPLDAASTTASGTTGSATPVGPTGTLSCTAGAGCEVVIAAMSYANTPSVFTEDAAFTTGGITGDQRSAFSIRSTSAAVTYAPTITASSGAWAATLTGYVSAVGGAPVNKLMFRPTP